MAALAFENERSKERLNSLVHPYLLRELRRRTQEASRTHAVVVIDAALLLNWNMDDEVAFVLVVHAARDIRLARLAARGISRPDGLARERAQLPYRAFRKRADRVILNNGSPEDLTRKIRKWFGQLPFQTG